MKNKKIVTPRIYFYPHFHTCTAAICVALRHFLQTHRLLKSQNHQFSACGVLLHQISPPSARLAAMSAMEHKTSFTKGVQIGVLFKNGAKRHIRPLYMCGSGGKTKFLGGQFFFVFHFYLFVFNF